MAKSRKAAADSGDLFIEPSGQLRITNKSAEQRAIEKRKIECLGMTFENDEARRAFFLEKLREKLKDPEFRRIEGFPLGDDENILALSDPPYYTACPNPFLQDFVSLHQQSAINGAPKNDYSRQPFAADTTGGKNDPLYNAHGYHTKSPWQVIAQYITHFTGSGDMILDAFAGTGMTGAATRDVGGGRKAILVELSPLATSIASRTVGARDAAVVRQRAERVLQSAVEKHAWMFATDHTGWDSGIRDHRKVKPSPSRGTGTIHFTVWSDVFRCSNCSRDLTYWSAAIDYESSNLQDDFPCPHCRARLRKDGLEKVQETIWDPLLRTQLTRSKQVPVLINYMAGSKRFEKTPDDKDIALLREIDNLIPSELAPTTKMLFRLPPWGDMYRAGYHAGMTHAHHFYWKRSLLVLADVFAQVRDDADLRYWFTSTLPWCNRENRLHIGNYFGKKGGVITSYRGAIYIASLGVETNPLERLRHRIDSALIQQPERDAKTIISTQSATSLAGVPDDTVDYVFIDPPFGGNLIYSELNFLWESWLRVWTNNEHEAIISTFQKKSLAEYEAILRKVLKELCRVLKPNRWITVQFHNSQNAVWIAIQTALFEAGFVVADVRTMDKGKGSFKQVVAAGAVKKDLVISAYKPEKEIEQRIHIERGSSDSAWAFVRSHLAHLPRFVTDKDGAPEVIAERQPFMLYDRMVAFHVQRGVAVPLSSSEFYPGLAQRFAERDGMYFLPDQVAEYDKKRIGASEVRQLSLVVTDEATAIQWIRQQLQRKPQTFQELQPVFMKESQTWARHERRMELQDMLEQNFLCYDGHGSVPSQIHSYLSTNFKELRNLDKGDERLIEKARGRCYVPDPNKQSDLEKLREKALLQEFADHKESKQKRLKVFRTEAVRAGFKAAWAARDYQTIVSVARKLPEDVVQEDPTILMYYDNASMRIES